MKPMPGKDEHSYKNPAYIYDEGRGGGGPDTRSSNSSSSSKSSSIKMIGTKLKSQSRTRWLALTIGVAVIIVVIIAIALAVLLTGDDSTESTSLTQVKADEDDLDIITTTTVLSPITTNRSKVTTMTTRKYTVTAQTTSKPLTSKTQTTTEKSKPTTTTAKVTMKPNVTDGNTTTKAATAKVTSARTNDPGPVTTLKPVDNPDGYSVTLNDVFYNPNDVKSLTLICRGHHQGDWSSLSIRRQFKDSYEPIITAVASSENSSDVHAFYSNISHAIVLDGNDVILSVTFDVFSCAELTNYTCSLLTEATSAAARANITILMPEPEVILPHSIIEDNGISIQCTAEVWGLNANLLWKIRQADSTKFMDFSVQPLVNITDKACTRLINSTLNFNASMYENGSDFRCEINDPQRHPQLFQPHTSDVTLYVVPSDYCKDKKQFTIHPHPNGPCTLVVYCLSTGPLVYEIECDPGHCYDYVTTACVPKPDL